MFFLALGKIIFIAVLLLSLFAVIAVFDDDCGTSTRLKALAVTLTSIIILLPTIWLNDNFSMYKGPVDSDMGITVPYVLGYLSCGITYAIIQWKLLLIKATTILRDVRENFNDWWDLRRLERHRYYEENTVTEFKRTNFINQWNSQVTNSYPRWIINPNHYQWSPTLFLPSIKGMTVDILLWVLTWPGLIIVDILVVAYKRLAKYGYQIYNQVINRLLLKYKQILSDL